MSHPFKQLKSTSHRTIFIPLLTLTLLIFLAMNAIGAPLNNPVAPSGIVSFEFAFTPTRAQQILNSWSGAVQLRAAFIQGLDFLFPLVYSATISLGCIMTANVLRAVKRPLARFGAPLAWGLWLAAGCDYIENISLVILLFGRVASPFPEIAGGCAAIKFSLILIGMVYSLYGLVIWMLPFKPLQSAT
jgi:hypothetical protein